MRHFIDCQSRYRDRRLRDHRLCLHPLGTGERRLKNRVQLIPGIPGFLCGKIGVPRLPENLILPDDHGLHAAYHAEKMVQCSLPLISSNKLSDLFAVALRKCPQCLLQRPETIFLPRHINFRAVAGGEEHTRLHPRGRMDFSQEIICLFFWDVKLLPLPGIRRFMTDTDTLHFFCRLLLITSSAREFDQIGHSP